MAALKMVTHDMNYATIKEDIIMFQEQDDFSFTH